MNVDIAWTAGIFEGEGSIVFGQGRSVALSTQMTDKDVIERMHQITRVGTVGGPYDYRGNKTTWTWRVHAMADVRLLLLIWYPLLGERRRSRALAALERLDTPPVRTILEACRSMGHPYTPENTYIWPNGKWRMCRACYRIRLERRKECLLLQ